MDRTEKDDPMDSVDMKDPTDRTLKAEASDPNEKTASAARKLKEDSIENRL